MTPAGEADATEPTPPWASDLESGARAGPHDVLIGSIVHRLEADFGDYVTADTLRHYVEDSHAQLSTRARVQTHVPVFVERFARQRLRALARRQGLIVDHRPVVLFVCEQNDGRSQMAAALFRATVGNRAVTHSAGAAPAAELLAEAAHALHEIGIDLVGEFPKPVTIEIEESADVIVTLDNHDDIVITENRRHMAWRLSDHDDGLAGYRTLRDELSDLVAGLARSLIPPPARLDAGLERFEPLTTSVRSMAVRVSELIDRLVPAVLSPDRTEIDGIHAGSEAINRAHGEIQDLTIGLLRESPPPDTLWFLVAVRELTDHLRRITGIIVDAAAIIEGTGLVVGGDIPSLMGEITSRSAAIVDDSVAAVLDGDLHRALGLEDEHLELERLHRQLIGQLEPAGLSPDDRLAAAGTGNAARLLTRAAGQAVEIAEHVIDAWIERSSADTY